MKEVKRILLAIALAVLVGFAVPIDAQSTEEAPEATAEATQAAGDTAITVESGGTVIVSPPVVTTSDPQLGYILFTVIVLAALATLVLIGRPLILKLGESAPAWAVEGGLSLGSAALDAAEARAKATPAAFDDEAIAQLRREFEALRAELRRIRAEQADALLSQG